jgi:hypothetical protein
MAEEPALPASDIVSEKETPDAGKVELLSPWRLPLAGFEVIIVGRCCSDHRGQRSIGPSLVLDQSIVRMSAPSWLGPDKKSRKGVITGSRY